MADCEHCGATDELVHTCNHCGKKYCPEHTLPENHHCPALRTDAVGTGETDIKDTDTNPADTSEPNREQRERNKSPEFESSPDVDVDGSVLESEEKSDQGQDEQSGDHILTTLKIALVGGFRPSNYNGRCPNCSQYVSTSVETDKAGIVRCQTCGWQPGYPGLRLVTHRFGWRKWKLRMFKSVKISLIVIAVLGFAGVFGTGITLVDDTADGLIKSAGLGAEADRAASAAADVGNSTSEESDRYYSGVDERRVEVLVHQYVNKERQQQGLANISHDPQLRRIARNHSEDMANRSYFSHTDPSGNDFSDRYAAAGYECQVTISDSRYATGGENIAQTWFGEPISGEGTYNTADELARGIVTQWMDSPGHRENILTPYWQSEGIGIEITDSGKVFATQDFC
ncbi:CAP domain-containing protein [Haloarcula sp. AONF1]